MHAMDKRAMKRTMRTREKMTHRETQIDIEFSSENSAVSEAENVCISPVLQFHFVSVMPNGRE